LRQAFGLRDHEQDGHYSKRDSADGEEQRDGTEPQSYVDTRRSAYSNSRWRCAPTMESPTARDA
jgi:hypothetical protein